MTSLSDGPVEYFVAGAPRSNHSGQVIVYTVDGRKRTTVVDTARGKQVRCPWGWVEPEGWVELEGKEEA